MDKIENIFVNEENSYVLDFPGAVQEDTNFLGFCLLYQRVSNCSRKTTGPTLILSFGQVLIPFSTVTTFDCYSLSVCIFATFLMNRANNGLILTIVRLKT